MGHIEHVISFCLERGLTFTVFRSNGRILLWVNAHAGLTDVAWGDLMRYEQVFLVSPFVPQNDGCLILEPAFRFDITKHGIDTSVLEQAEGSSSAGSSKVEHWSREGHAAAIRSLRSEMADGRLEKVVLSRTMEIPFNISSAGKLFVNAMRERPEAFVCMLNCPEFGTWVGASPEMLVEADNGAVRVDSIAGTLPLDAAPARSSDWGAKEQEEQAMVTRSVLQTFNELELPEIAVDGPEILRTAQVAHLHTRLHARVGNIPLARLVKALHPTPAMCGLPREKALASILELEPHSRLLYAGFWGPWQCQGSSRLYVNIRSIRLMNDRAILYVGGGITAGSDPEKEWEETEQKALTWQRPLEALRSG